MSRILLCLGDPHERDRLERALSVRHACRTHAPGAPTPAETFEVIVLDAAEHARRPELAHAPREGDGRPPALLLVVSRAEAAAMAPDVASSVDDLVFAPVDAVELELRVTRLAAARNARPPAAEDAALASELRSTRARLDVQESVADEMTALAASDRPLHEVVERGATHWRALFPDTCSAVLLEGAYDRGPTAQASSGLPDALEDLVAPLRAIAAQVHEDGAGGPMVVGDVERDARSAPFLEVLRAHAVRACWFLPIVSPQRARIGTFAVCARVVGGPTPTEVAIGGRAARLVGVVAERDRTLRELRESEARLRVVFDHSPVAIALYRPDGRLAYADEAFWALVDRPERSLPSDDWATLVHADEREDVRATMRELVADHAPRLNRVVRLVTPSGRERTVHALVNAVREDRAPSGYVVTLEDISERVRLEEELRQAQKLEAVGRFAGGIAHDFNNLVTIILGGVDVLERSGGLSEIGTEIVGQIGAAAERAVALTRELLAFSRHRTPQRRAVDLRDVVSTACVSLEPLVGKETELRAKLGPSPVAAYVDRPMIEQVLSNLVINARDAMPGGGAITVGLDTVVVQPDGGRDGAHAGGAFARLTVQDTGTGIPEEALPHVFEPFYSTKEPHQGTGLGLAIVHGIVTQHDGFVEVESEPGRGATFRVHLPLRPTNQPTGSPDGVGGDPAAPTDATSLDDARTSGDSARARAAVRRSAGSAG